MNALEHLVQSIERGDKRAALEDAERVAEVVRRAIDRLQGEIDALSGEDHVWGDDIPSHFDYVTETLEVLTEDSWGYNDPCPKCGWTHSDKTVCTMKTDEGGRRTVEFATAK